MRRALLQVARLGTLEEQGKAVGATNGFACLSCQKRRYQILGIALAAWQSSQPAARDLW
jgi:hypothetical protein